jgi:group I intron endonuclease
MGYLHLAEIQKITKLEFMDKSGIYGFLCKTNNKLYIGSSINLTIRFDSQIKGSRSNILLQNAINKYNLSDFIFIVFEYCEQEDLILREQFYMDSLKPEYNILKVAGSLLGYIHSEESIAKISFALSGENNPMFGRIRENHHFFGKTHTADTKAKMSAAQGTAIYVYSSDKSTLVNSFCSANKAAESFKCCHKTIKRYIKNGELFRDKWILSTSLITKG